MKSRFFILLVFLLAVSSVQSYAQVQSIDQIQGRKAYIQGIEAFTFEDYKKAEELLTFALTKLGGEPGVNFALADVYFALDDLALAAFYGKEAVNGAPENKYYRLKLANIYKRAGQNQDTIDELTALIEQRPTDLDALFMLADTYKDYGQPVKSNQVLAQIIKLTGPSFAANYQRFLNFQTLGARDSTIAELQIIQNIDPDNLEIANLLSELYQNNNQTDKAKNSLNDALRRNARDPETLIQLSGIYIDEAKWDSAGTLLGSIMSDEIVPPENKLRVAQYLFNRQNREPNNVQLKVETGRVLDLFVETEGDYGPAFSISGEFYARTGENEKALERLSRATEILPQDDIAWRQRLQLLLAENKLDEAIEAGKQADEYVPEDAFIQFFIGSAYLLNDNHAIAAEWFEKASRAPARRPFKSVVYASLGDAYSAIDQWEDAKRAYDLAIRFDQDNHNVKNNYAYALSVRRENLEKAKEMALSALEIEPENAAYLDTIGWVYYMLEDYDRARRFIRLSVDTGESSAEVYEHLGDVYEKLNNLEEAKKWWKQSLEKDPTRVHLKDKIDA